SLPIPTHGAGEPIGILTRVDVQLSQAAQILIAAIRKTVPF
ncbi:MAG: LysR family transcriptional regulator, partial [Citrobacter freundii]|nr:LysR family transcriptional regulator [Citrobacter freundii]